MGEPRRLFVSFPTLNARTRFLAPQVDSLVDSLRAVLANDGRYVLIPVDSVREALARTRTVSAIAELLRVDLFASVAATVLPDTSILWQITSRDLGAHSAYATRTVTKRNVRPNLLSGLDSLVLQAKTSLREQDHAPRRAPVHPPQP
jgi:hypothetical protein